ncbi:MAG: hypothetical protein JSR17_10765 [Proteobacteria bacterium]|nr:hypothetical protein [Pseudomonadota bacterium]
MPRGTRKAPVSNPTPAVVPNPAPVASPVPMSPRLQRYLQEEQARKSLNAKIQIGAGIWISLAYGVLMTVVTFAAGYFLKTNLAWMLKDYFAGMFTMAFKLMLPTALAPIAPYMPLLMPASMLMTALYYSYKTNTLGFGKPGKGLILSVANMLGYTLPFISFGLGANLGFDIPTVCKFTFGASVASGLYLSFGKQILTAMLNAPAQQAVERPQPPAPDMAAAATPTPSPTFSPKQKKGAEADQVAGQEITMQRDRQRGRKQSEAPSHEGEAKVSRRAKKHH